MVLLWLLLMGSRCGPSFHLLRILYKMGLLQYLSPARYLLWCSTLPLNLWQTYRITSMKLCLCSQPLQDHLSLCWPGSSSTTTACIHPCLSAMLPSIPLTCNISVLPLLGSTLMSLLRWVWLKSYILLPPKLCSSCRSLDTPRTIKQIYYSIGFPRSFWVASIWVCFALHKSSQTISH